MPLPQPNRLDRSLVVHLATLARLELSESELAELGSELEEVLSYMQLLDEARLPADGAPLDAPVEHGPWRADRPEAALPVAVALGGSAHATERGFVVPSFVERTRDRLP